MRLVALFASMTFKYRFDLLRDNCSKCLVYTGNLNFGGSRRRKTAVIAEFSGLYDVLLCFKQRPSQTS